MINLGSLDRLIVLAACRELHGDVQRVMCMGTRVAVWLASGRRVTVSAEKIEASRAYADARARRQARPPAPKRYARSGWHAAGAWSGTH